jgi:ADP-ribose pyrophosphatase YjhB (NUDIX family)
MLIRQRPPYSPARMEHLVIYNRPVTWLFQQYWRWTRSHTLGAEGIVIDADGRVLLVRHGYRPGWHFPGGGVEKNEAVISALERELMEETGVEVIGAPELFGVFSNAKLFPGDQVVVYVVRTWRRPSIPAPNKEIAEQRFFAPNELPDGLAKGTRRRLAELFEGKPRDPLW